MPFRLEKNKALDFTSAVPHKISYHQENRVWRIAKDVLSLLFLPVGLYRAWHRLVGLAVVPASMRTVLLKIGLFKINPADNLENALKTLDQENWGLQRITIETDGLQIDATLLMPPQAKQNRWTLYSTGNAEHYEDVLSDFNHCNQLFGKNGLNTNVLLFNYPGVGKSGGLPSRNGSVQAYRNLLRWLENEVQAKELIGFGHSIGGGIQAEAIAHHPKKEGVHYCFIKDRTFSHLSGVAEDLTEDFTQKKIPILGGILGPIVKKIIELSSWNIQTAKASLLTPLPEVILQKGPSSAQPIQTEWEGVWKKVEPDDIIHSTKSLAMGLANEKYLNKINLAAKTILLVPESHNSRLNTESIKKLAESVNHKLQEK